MFVAKCNDEIANDHDAHVWDHCRQSHLRLTDATILHCGSLTDPVTQRPSSRQTKQCTNEDGKVEEPNGLWAEVVRRCSKVLALGEVDRQERAARPGNHESRELNDGVDEELPRDPKVHENGLERVGVGLEELPLLFARRSLPEPRIAFGGRLYRKLIHDRGRVRSRAVSVSAKVFRFDLLRSLLRACWRAGLALGSQLLDDVFGVLAVPFPRNIVSA